MAYLLLERLLLAQRVRSIPLRICITGTRGKSSVTRLIAAVLREAGFKVLAKTTGSKPVIIFPDGTEKEIKRRGSPSILEEKTVLKIGAGLHAQALVLELMSIHPERSYVESVQMVNPHIFVITNVRPDHISQMGSSKAEIARSFASSISENSTIFVLQEELFPVFKEVAERLNSKLIKVDRNSYEEYFESEEKLPIVEFKENICLSLAVGEFLRIDKRVAFQGMDKVRPDFGSLKVWSAELGSPPRCWFLVSGFAANDPESTRKVISRLQEKNLFERKEVIGLLNLRHDRGDRTLQWLKTLKEGGFPEFRKLVFIGDHAHALKRRLKLSGETEIFIFKPKAPQRIMEGISEIEKRDAVLVGMGNMGGIGKELVKYWENIGRPYDF